MSRKLYWDFHTAKQILFGFCGDSGEEGGWIGICFICFEIQILWYWEDWR